MSLQSLFEQSQILFAKHRLLDDHDSLWILDKKKYFQGQRNFLKSAGQKQKGFSILGAVPLLWIRIYQICSKKRKICLKIGSKR